MIPYAGQLKDYKWNIESVRNHHKKKVEGVDNYKHYNNSIITFDIETSSAWIDEHGDIIGYRKGMSEDYWNSLTPLCLCYIWQCSVDGTVYYGRELKDFLLLLKDIPSDIETIIYVHNLSYEFHFLADVLTWTDVFARTPHKPMKAKSKEFPNIEFRCSYMLTRLSLEAWGKQLGLPKMVGDVDYEVLRTPLTELTEKELGYCERDCLVVDKGILKYREEYGSIRNIPLTQTGTVRKVIKDKLTADPAYVKWIKRLVPYNALEYKRLQDIFAGGYTHANRLYAGHVIEDYIEHYDFASSYPTIMVACKFPCSPWRYTGQHVLPRESRFENFAYIIHVRFTDIRSTSFNTYIQRSKCIIEDAELDNGRVISAKSLEIWITEQDLITIKHNYRWRKVETLHLYESRKDYLPKEFREYVLELYGRKTSLKGVPGMEEIYNQAKQYVNSLFGLMVTAVLQADITFTPCDDGWEVQALTMDMVNEKLGKLKSWYPSEKRYFLNYSWGCWVCAYGRRFLWSTIEHENEDGTKNDHDVLYADTDSIFIRGKHDFSWYNDGITEKLRKSCEETGIDFELTHPKTPKGKEKPLGIFDREPDICEFITLGAKRYCERRVEDGKLHLTISGINKEAVEMLEDDIENFRDGFIFDKDSMNEDGEVMTAEFANGEKGDCVTKKMHHYIINQPDVIWPDGYVSTYKHGINLRRTGYTLGITDEYSALIQLMSDITDEDMPEHLMQTMRGRFI